MNILLCAADWQAIGGIGTMVGSLATAIAVIVAIIQLKQPTKKKIRVKTCTAFGVTHSNTLIDAISVAVSNVGNRSVEIQSIKLNLLYGNKSLVFLDNSAFLVEVTLPYQLEVEKQLTFYILQEALKQPLRNFIQQTGVSIEHKVRFEVTDALNVCHKSSKHTIRNLLA